MVCTPRSRIEHITSVRLIIPPIDLVKSALGEAVRNKVRSIRYVDKVLLNYRQQAEIKKEGTTTISEKWRKDINETMNIAKTRGVKDDD